MNEFFTLIGKEDWIVKIIAVLWLLGRAQDFYNWIVTGYTKRQNRECSMAMITENRRKLEILEQSVSALLQHRFFAECERMIAQGFVTTADLELVHTLYTPYHASGLNGQGTNFFKIVTEKLPVRKED